MLRDRLRGGPTRANLQESRRESAQLQEDRGAILEHDAERQELLDKLDRGAVSEEDAERRQRETQESLPERVKPYYTAARAELTATRSLSLRS